MYIGCRCVVEMPMNICSGYLMCVCASARLRAFCTCDDDDRSIASGWTAAITCTIFFVRIFFPFRSLCYCCVFFVSAGLLQMIFLLLLWCSYYYYCFGQSISLCCSVTKKNRAHFFIRMCRIDIHTFSLSLYMSIPPVYSNDHTKYVIQLFRPNLHTHTPSEWQQQRRKKNPTLFHFIILLISFFLSVVVVTPNFSFFWYHLFSWFFCVDLLMCVWLHVFLCCLCSGCAQCGAFCVKTRQHQQQRQKKKHPKIFSDIQIIVQ